MSDEISHDPINAHALTNDLPPLVFNVQIGEGDQVVLVARSPNGETLLPLTGLQAARLGRALLTASVALHAGNERPPAGSALEDCQFPIRRWIVARSGRNGLPIITTVLPGNIGLTFQLDEASVGKCGASLVELAQQRPLPLLDGGPNGGDLPI
ncbi:hypothetical protein [Pseudochelatococcus sp. G4_1912]|uniref:hypothetical protein n=1 Tax=Pseudochelatococcus sp. G4_1912 TaxID=3114288 RepID=UPI0039C75F89